MGEDDQAAYLYARLSTALWVRDYQKAWDACQEGLSRLAGAEDSPDLAYLLAEAGRIAHFSVQPKEQVVFLCSQAIAMSERLGILEPKAEASITLALTRDEPQAEIALLQDIAVLCEAHGLLSTAARAHLNLGDSNEKLLGGAEQSFQHNMKVAEIGGRMGDVNSIFWGLANAIELWVNFVNLGDIEDHVAAYLHKSSASESQVNEYLQYAHAVVSSQKGEWMHDLEYRRERLRKLHKGGDLQIIANVNLWLALDILELNRFTGQDYLAEAEAALMENVAIQWFVTISQIFLANISARKGLIHEAHERLDEVSKVRLYRLQESYRLIAETELAMAEGHWDQAVVTCQTSIDIYQPGGYRWQWSRRLIDLGDAFRGRDGPGDRERAQETYRQSLEMFTEMGASGYVKVLEQRLGGIGAQPTAA